MHAYVRLDALSAALWLQFVLENKERQEKIAGGAFFKERKSFRNDALIQRV